MVEKIQSSLVNAIPLWKNQMVISLLTTIVELINVPVPSGFEFHDLKV